MDSEAQDTEAYNLLFRMKLDIPVISHKATMRRRLDEKLNSGLSGRLTLVTAPAGFGKTTAVAAWLRKTDLKAAWFSIDSGDNNLKRFWSYLIDALNTIQPGIKSGFSQYLYATNSVIIEDVVTTLVDELSSVKDDFILVLDDYQLIDDIPIHVSLALLIRYLPQNAHVVVISRTKPPFYTARLQTIGEIMEVGSSDLQFNTDEIQEFCRVNGKSIFKNDISALEVYTEGWAAGLCMIMDSNSLGVDCDRLFSAGNWDSQRIASYLTEEVINRWDREEKDFMLRTSILSEMTGQLCDALTGQIDGKRMLERLASHNAFVTQLDEKGIWYGYHHIYSEFLKKRLEQINPSLLYSLHDQAGEWYERNGYLPEAVTHFLQNENFDRASEIIERLGRDMLSSGEFSTLLDWLGSIPRAIIQIRPILCLTYAWALLLTDNTAEASSWIDAVEDGDKKLSSDETDEKWKKQIQGEIAAAKAFVGLKQNSPGATLQYVMAYKDLNLKKSIFCSYGLNSNRGEASLLAGMFGFKGKLELLDQGFLEIYKITREIKTYHFGYIPVVVGELFYERNNIDEAVPLLTAGMKDAERSNTSASFVPAVITLARAEIYRGNKNGAFEIVGDGAKKLQNMGGAHVLPLLSAFKARLNIVTGDLDAAEEWTRKNCLEISDAPSSLRMYEQITLARVLLAKKEFDNCILLLYKLLLYTEKEQNLLYTIELLNLSAILYYSIGQTQKAMEMLQKALALGEKDRYKRIFIEEGIAMAELLEKYLKWYIKQEPEDGLKISPLYIRYLFEQTRDCCVTIKSFTKHIKNQSGEVRQTKPLTKREKEVLRLLDSALTNAEIASALNIALNTVKVNCTNIYRKLDVNNRDRAVSIARELKLLN